MRRVCWTADFAEANIVAGLLRANGIEATVFDAGMAQLNWMETLAIGGYRIMVADADAQAARDLLIAYRDGKLDLLDEGVDQPTCLDCAKMTGENRNRRGAVFFLSWLGLNDLLFAALFFVFVVCVPLAFAVAPQVFAIFCIALVAAFSLFLLRWAKRRYRCASCTSTWQAPMSEFDALRRAVDAAEVKTTDHAAP